MIDFHCHILPGIDDGAISIDESLVMARLLQDFGYKTICCTPHCIKSYYDLSPQKVREAVLILQADLDNAGIELDLLPGMEYMLDEHLSASAEDFLPLGDTSLVLCEAPPQAHPQIVQQGLELIIEKGFVPLIAHPERTEYFYTKLSKPVTDVEEIQPAPKGFFQRLSPFSSRTPRPKSSIAGPELPDACLFQANLGSFTGYYGSQVQLNAYELLKGGVYTALASDLHDGTSAQKILSDEKISSNPLLHKLAYFDGVVNVRKVSPEGLDSAVQGDLFR